MKALYIDTYVEDINFKHNYSKLDNIYKILCR